MIKISPYYAWKLEEQKKFLAYYLNLVADVVPFLPEDVLDEIEKDRDSLSDNHRKRTSSYVNLLNKYGIIGMNKDPRIQDALLAKALIGDFSEGLYHALYDEPTEEKPGAVDRSFLRELLTVKFDNKDWRKRFEFKIKEKKGTDPSIVLRDQVFRFEAFSKRKPWKKDLESPPRDIYQLLEMMNVSVCPYCNRQYITTVAYGNKHVRPQLDHFYNKKDFPYLALSINNLVPSCGVCNLIKHDNNPEEEMLYPYVEGMDNSFVFHANCNKENITSLLQGANDALDNFDLTLEKNEAFPDPELAKRAKTSIEILALDQLYKSHKGYVSNLFFQRYVFSNELLDDIQIQFGSLFKTKEEVKHMLRLMDYSPEQWNYRPLAKLTHDISEQIDKLYAHQTSLILD